MPSCIRPSRFSRSGLLWPYRLIRWGLALVFLYAGASKLADPEAFAIIIAAYGLVPETLLMPLAIALPALEVVSAAALLVDLRGSLATIAVLLILFMLVLGYGIWMGLDIDCGCFAPEDPEGRAYAGLRPALYRDCVLAAGVLLLYGVRHCCRFNTLGIDRRTDLTLKEETHDALL